MKPLEGIRGILIDIEGTTTPVSFVYDVLFPFAAERLEAACARAAEDSRIADAVSRLQAEYAGETCADLPGFGNGAPYARHLMSRDRKSTGLKALQGIIWEDGYRSQELVASVYDDVPPALERWHSDGIRLRIFSSGSVLAQKLLFAHTEHSDLTRWFEGYHDTTTGPKREAVAYRTIAEAFELPPANLLFLSDVVEELDAAAEAGLRTVLLVRPGNKPTVPGRHLTCGDFSFL